MNFNEKIKRDDFTEKIKRNDFIEDIRPSEKIDKNYKTKSGFFVSSSEAASEYDEMFRQLDEYEIKTDSSTESYEDRTARRR
jgi:hypothetical protein